MRFTAGAINTADNGVCEALLAIFGAKAKPTTENDLRWPEIDGRPRGEESDRAVLTHLATNQSESEATTECGNETKGPSAIDNRPCICCV